MNENRSSCPDDKAEAVARFIHAVKNMSQSEFKEKYINESGDSKMEVSSNNVKYYLDDWTMYNDRLDDLLNGIDRLCDDNAAVSELVYLVRLYSKEQGQLEEKLEKLGISEEDILKTYYNLCQKEKF
jgi:hypothetical protein